MNNKKTIPFFSKEENISLIKQVRSGLNFLDTSDSADKNGQFVVTALKSMLQSILSNAGKYDELCQTNIEWIGESFIDAIKSYLDKSSIDKNKLGSIFTMAYRFLCELEFSTPGELNIDLRQIKNSIDDHLDFFTPNEKGQLIYANFIMPANIAKKIIHSENIQDVKSLNNFISDAEAKKEEWIYELEKKRNEISELSDKLEKYKNAFNFVGLYDGFKQLSDEKNKEKLFIFVSLMILGISIISPLIFEIIYTLKNQQTIIENKDTLIYAALPMITFEVILIYFFRIILFNYKSVKSLLVQIELRKTLCQFIQNYSDYSAIIKEKDPGSLEKFENLIFSGLVTNEGNLPSTFDGVEQLAKFVKSAK